MKIKSDWIAKLSNSNGTPSFRLAEALGDDIINGTLKLNSRLPAHRDLADKLGISVGTVTKAYSILEKRGLVRTVMGSGTFVALFHPDSNEFIDLSRNIPPAGMTDNLLKKTFISVAKHIDSSFFNYYPPIGGHKEHKRQLAHWFEQLGVFIDYQYLLLTTGAQNALFIAFSIASGYGGTLFVEEYTYPNAIKLAQSLGINLISIQMDDQGMIDESLARALHQYRLVDRKVIYLTPTRQNPTTATMSNERRQAIVEVCQKYNVTIIEDDIYALPKNNKHIPFIMLAPERTIYVNSLSKILSPALRIGGMVVPAYLYEQAERFLSSTSLMVSTVTCAIMERWFIEGITSELIDFIRLESKRRYQIARNILGDNIGSSDYEGSHIWLPMMTKEALRIESAARMQGVIVTPPKLVCVNQNNAMSGIRLCLGSPSTLELKTALITLKKILNSTQTLIENSAD